MTRRAFSLGECYLAEDVNGAAAGHGNAVGGVSRGQLARMRGMHERVLGRAVLANLGVRWPTWPSSRLGVPS